MAKSVFISSTSKDLPEHRAAVDKAIRRLGMRPINMDDFGSQPGGASGVSVREVSKADVFVGIIAQRYGYVPEGMDKSVTEQEYDEAVRRKLPRLMYLLNPNYDWSADRVEADAGAQAKLAAFRARIEKNEVRSLFGAPEDLASQLIADLTKLDNKQRRQQLVMRLIAAMLLAILGIAFVLAATPEIRTPLLVGLNVITETYTPSITPSPTNTSTPTSTPTITPTPLEGTPFAEDEVGVVLADFTMIDPNAPRAERGLERDFADAAIPFVRVHHELKNREEAQAVSNLYNATIVIWGEVQLGGVQINVEVTPRQSLINIDIGGALLVSAAELESFEAYIFTGMDAGFIIDVVQGEIAYFDMEYDSALVYYNRAVAAIPKDRAESLHADTLYFKRGNTYSFQDKYDLALDDYNKAIELKPDFADAYRNRGWVYNAQGIYNKALDDYNKAIDLNPEFADSYSNRGVVYYIEGDYSHALDDYNKAIELNPNYAEALLNRGLVYYHQGDYSHALDDYNKAIELKPDFADAYRNRGSAYAAQSDYSHALDDYNKAIELKPDFAGAYNDRGQVYDIQGDYSRALDDYNKAIELNPDFADAYINRGGLYADQRDFGNALNDYNKAIELNPDYAEAYYNRGRIYFFQSDNVQAIDDYTSAINLKPDFVQAYTNRAIAYISNEEFDEAITDLTQVIELNPNLVDVYGGRGLAYYYKGDYYEALADLQTYAQMAGEQADQGLLDLITQVMLQLGTATPIAEATAQT